MGADDLFQLPTKTHPNDSAIAFYHYIIDRRTLDAGIVFSVQFDQIILNGCIVIVLVFLKLVPLWICQSLFR